MLIDFSTIYIITKFCYRFYTYTTYIQVFNI